MTKTKTEIATMIVKAVVETSATYVISTIIKTVCPATTKTQRVKLIVGAYAISGVVATKCGKAIEVQIKDLIETIEKIKSKDFQ